jgi:hypothetical protein
MSSDLQNLIDAIEEEFPSHSWIVKKNLAEDRIRAGKQYFANIMPGSYRGVIGAGSKNPTMCYADDPHEALQMSYHALKGLERVK